MGTTRRDLLTSAIGAAGAALAPLENARADKGHDDDDHGHQTIPSDAALRVKALETLLVAKGVIDPAALDALIDTYEHKIGPRNGARVVARAWVDLEYRKRLLADATAAIAELGYQGGEGNHMVAVENTPHVHNLVVCTGVAPLVWTDFPVG